MTNDEVAILARVTTAERHLAEVSITAPTRRLHQARLDLLRHLDRLFSNAKAERRRKRHPHEPHLSYVERENAHGIY